MVMADFSLNPLLANSTVSFSFMADPQLTVQTDTISCSLLCWICNLALCTACHRNTAAHVSWLHSDSVSSKYFPGIRIVELCSRSDSGFVRHIYTCSHRGCHEQWGFSFHPWSQKPAFLSTICWRWTFPSAYVWGIFIENPMVQLCGLLSGPPILSQLH